MSNHTHEPDYKTLFTAAVSALAQIDDALGIGSDGCSNGILETLQAIDYIKAERDQLRAEVERLRMMLRKATQRQGFSNQELIDARAMLAGSPATPAPAITDDMIDAALDAWFDGDCSRPHYDEHIDNMRRALTAAMGVGK